MILEMDRKILSNCAQNYGIDFIITVCYNIYINPTWEGGENMTDNELLQAIYSDMQELKQRVTGIEVTLENETNKNIKLLAENHGNLIDKLNQAIRVSDKTAIYEIQVNILTGKVEKLEKEIADLKNRIA